METTTEVRLKEPCINQQDQNANVIRCKCKRFQFSTSNNLVRREKTPEWKLSPKPQTFPPC